MADKRPRRPGEYAPDPLEINIERGAHTAVTKYNDATSYNLYESVLMPKSYDYTTFSRRLSEYVIVDAETHLSATNTIDTISGISKNHILFPTNTTSSIVNVYQSTISTVVESGSSVVVNSAAGAYVQLKAHTYGATFAAITDWSEIYLRHVLTGILYKVVGYSQFSNEFLMYDDISGIFSEDDVILVVRKAIDKTKPYWKSVDVFSIASKTAISKASTAVIGTGTPSLSGSIDISDGATFGKIAIYIGSTRIGEFSNTGAWTTLNSATENNISFSIETDGRVELTDVEIIFSDASSYVIPDTAVGTSSVRIFPSSEGNWYTGTSFPSSSTYTLFYYNDVNNWGVNDFLSKGFWCKKYGPELTTNKFFILADKNLISVDNVLAAHIDASNMGLQNTTGLMGEYSIQDIIMKAPTKIADYSVYTFVLADFEFYNTDTFEETTIFTSVSISSSGFLFGSSSYDDKFYYVRSLKSKHAWMIKNSSTAFDRTAANYNMVTCPITSFKDMTAEDFPISYAGNDISIADAVRGAIPRTLHTSFYDGITVSGDAGISGAVDVGGALDVIGSIGTDGNIDMSGNLVIGGSIYNEQGELLLGQEGAGVSLPGISDMYYRNEQEKVFSSTIPDIDGSITEAWTTLSVLPSSRSALASFSLNGFGYNVGGYNGSTRIAVYEKYNDITDSWASSSLSQSIAYLSAFSLNGFGYRAGGSTSTSEVDTSEKYNDTTDSWTASAVIAPARDGLAAFSLNSFGYNVGGTGPSAVCQKYNDATDSWATAAVINPARTYIAALELNGFGYNIGGSGPSSVCQKYNDATDAWSTIDALNSARSALAAFSLNSFGYNVGGTTGSVSSVCEKYNDATDSWSYTIVIGTARSFLSAFSLNGFGYNAGGFSGVYESIFQKFSSIPLYKVVDINYTGAAAPSKIIGNIGVNFAKSEPSNSELNKSIYNRLKFRVRTNPTDDWTVIDNGVVEDDLATLTPVGAGYIYEFQVSIPDEFSPRYYHSDGLNTWTIVASISPARQALAAFSLNGFGYNVGGYAGATYTCQKYNDTTDYWSTITATSLEREALASFSLNGFGYNFGGDSVGSPTNICQKYNDATDSWSSAAVISPARTGLAAFSLNGFGYNIGGWSGVASSVCEKYNDASNSWLSAAVISPGRYGLAAFSLNGFGYNVGGTTGSQSSVCQKYNDATDSWATAAIISPARSALAAFSLNGFGYNIGGTTGSYSTVCQKYNDATDSWATAAVISPARSFPAGLSLNNFGYNVGGYTGSSNSAVSQRYNDSIVKNKITGFSVKIIE